MAGPSQFDVALGVRQGLLSQPLLEHRAEGASQHAVATVGVAEGEGVDPRRGYARLGYPRSRAHRREMSSNGRSRSLAQKEARSARLSSKSAGVGTSRPRRDLLPGASGRTPITGVS